MSTDTESVPPVERRVGYLLKAAQHALRMRLDDRLKAFGITTPQYAVLTVVERDPGISNAALARAAFVTPQTMQGIVSNLERLGLLSRSPDPGHGRVLRTVLTPQGEGTLRSAHAIASEVEEAMMSRLDARDRDRLAAMLALCLEGLGVAPLQPAARASSSPTRPS